MASLFSTSDICIYMHSGMESASRTPDLCITGRCPSLKKSFDPLDDGFRPQVLSAWGEEPCGITRAFREGRLASAGFSNASPPKTGGLGRKILLMGFCLTGVDSGDVLKSEFLSSKKLPQGISKHGQLSIIDRGLTPRAARVVHSLEWLFFQFFLILPRNGNMFQI